MLNLYFIEFGMKYRGFAIFHGNLTTIVPLYQVGRMTGISMQLPISIV